jgi:hypothetical protein
MGNWAMALAAVRAALIIHSVELESLDVRRRATVSALLPRLRTSASSSVGRCGAILAHEQDFAAGKPRALAVAPPCAERAGIALA